MVRVLTQKALNNSYINQTNKCMNERAYTQVKQTNSINEFFEKSEHSKPTIYKNT